MRPGAGRKVDFPLLYEKTDPLPGGRSKTRVTFGRGPDVMAGAGTGHRPARMSRWEGAHATLRSGPVGDSVLFP